VQVLESQNLELRTQIQTLTLEATELQKHIAVAEAVIELAKVAPRNFWP